MPLYLVWIQSDQSLETSVAYASPHPIARGDLIDVAREPCCVERIEAAAR